MNLQIDWVSTGLFLVAYVFARVPGVPPRAGNGAIALACVGIAVYRLRMGQQSFNLVFVGLAVVLALYYGARALKSGPRRRATVDDED